jgi:inhibitor of KinA sporulation pathway (predicted exonuclease)
VTLDYKSIIVVDVEATCWQGKIPPGQQNEIIEIGVCRFDLEAREPAEKRSILVKPERSQVSDFCTELTTLTQAQVDTGLSFVEACALLEDAYKSQTRVWASWGNYDRQIFQQQCASFQVDYPFSNRHINLKKHFGRYHNNGRQVGMARALDMAKLTLEGTHHRGGDDAWNIARLLQFMLNQHGEGILRL